MVKPYVFVRFFIIFFFRVERVDFSEQSPQIFRFFATPKKNIVIIFSKFEKGKHPFTSPLHLDDYGTLLASIWMLPNLLTNFLASGS